MNFYKVKGFWLFRMKVTSAKPKLQVKCKGKTSFSFISTQRYRDTEDYLISLKTLLLYISSMVLSKQLENIYCLLTILYQSLSVKTIGTMIFEEAVVISPTPYAGFRKTTDNRPTRQTSMR